MTFITWLKEQFVLADIGGKGRLSEKEILSVVRQLNEQIPESVVKQRFKVGNNDIADNCHNYLLIRIFILVLDDGPYVFYGD